MWGAVLVVADEDSEAPPATRLVPPPEIHVISRFTKRLYFSSIVLKLYVTVHMAIRVLKPVYLDVNSTEKFRRVMSLNKGPFEGQPFTLHCDRPGPDTS